LHFSWVPYEGGKRTVLKKEKTRQSNQETIWTRRFGDDYCSGVMSPLFFSYLRDRFGAEHVKYYKGYLYVTTSFLLGLLQPQNHPKFIRKYIIKTYFPDFMQDTIESLPYKWYRKLAFTMVIAIKQPALLPSKTAEAYNKFENDYMAYVKQFDQQLSGEMDLAKIIELDKELDERFLPHWLLAFGGGIHGIIFTSFMKGYIEKWFDDQTLYDRLFSNVFNRTMETNMDLFYLAEEVRNDTNLSALFKKSADEIHCNLSSYPFFNERFCSVLEKHGHRCPNRDIVYPRWKEDPIFVIEIIKQIAASSKQSDQLKEENEKKQRRAEDELLAVSFLKKRILKKQLHYARTYIQFREDQRFVLDLHLSRKRDVYLKIGKILEAKQFLDNEADIFFFDGNELEDLSAGGISDVKERVRTVKIKYELFKRAHPPEFLQDGQEIGKKGATPDVLQGTAASSGKCTGIAQVVTTIEELPRLGENSILVTRFTDPGWTPCFHKISGLVTEIGGILSHGAIIAREYGIPAVTGIEHVFDYLSSGDVITVDGTEGKVYIDKKNIK
jgi:phosphohistidine swiveling domain-containing protein